jgi:hypothetical protein
VVVGKKWAIGKMAGWAREAQACLLNYKERATLLSSSSSSNNNVADNKQYN